MKNLVIAAMILISATSCNGVGSWFGDNTDSASVANTVDSSFNTVWLRDESITAANAYSDLFLDSAAVDSFIIKEKLNDTAAGKLRNFYKVRNYQYAWFTTNGLTEQGQGFWGLHSSNTDTKKEGLGAMMDTIIQKDSLIISQSDSAFTKTELQLTQRLIEYAGGNTNGLISSSNIYYLVPAKKMDAMQLADSILNKQKDSSVFATNTAYSSLKKALAFYYTAAKDSAQKILPASLRQTKKGASSPFITALKKRMAATGDYTTTDTTATYTDSFQMAVKDFQLRNGLAVTGQVNDSLLATLNVPALERVEQILVNLNRVLWMKPVADSNYVVVNIPSYMLYVHGDSNTSFEMPIIVGKEGTGTVMFSDAINQVVFNPTWKLPESIVRNEILPAMKQDKDYLKKHNMEITGGPDSLPQIKQLPGKDNSLGRVKFLFPNNFDIYMHDTPNKNLFAQKNRSLSHGCIRVANPEKLAAYILRNQKEWTPEKIKTAMNSSKEQTVQVPNPLPVQINYYTAWADKDGKLHFRNDVYGHDKTTKGKMFIG